MLGEQDTIAAIGTAQGVGALSIVRITGRGTHDVLKRCFSSSQNSFAESHRAFYGLWNNPETREAVDEVLVLNFTDGKGFTGEDAADVICHGGAQVTSLVLEAALRGGARLARPGEFTYRAVMNNKLDLARAESVLDLIQANSPRAAALALKNVRGGLSRAVVELESEVIFILANLEASIDFTTEDIQPVESSQILARVSLLRRQLLSLNESYVKNRAVKQGVRVALVGQPNVGKSSLLNALVGKSRSIVADLPGTTRDTIEEDILIGGALVRLIDTAGLRVEADAVETEGIKRAREEIAGADLVLFIVDAVNALDEFDVKELKALDPTRVLICFNKIDARQVTGNDEKAGFALNEYRHVLSSAHSSGGTDDLRIFLKEVVSQLSPPDAGSLVSTQRQRELLERAESRLAAAQRLLEEEASPEFVSFEMKEALISLQEVLGKNAGDDIMDRVFKEFCIGK